MSEDSGENLGKEALRSVLICLEYQCTICRPSVRHVPVICPYAILHALSDDPVDEERPRQSGKTRRLVEIANKIAKMGKGAYFVTRNRSMADYVERKYKLHSGVTIITISEIRASFGRMPVSPGFIVADEIDDEEMAVVRRLLDYGHTMVSRMWTR